MPEELPDYHMKHAVHELNGEELLPAGTKITPSVLQAMIERGGSKPALLAMMEYRSVKDDLFDFFTEAPYNVIFNEERKKRILTIGDDVVLPKPILESLYHFRDVDSYTYRHTILVFALSVLVADRLVENENLLREGIVAGPTHDIGKLCIPISILTKTDPLTCSEKSFLRHHTLAGYVLLSYYYRDFGTLAARVARDHHERKDGSGYPFGVVIDDIMIDIIVVIDVYDALISPRPYRPVSFSNRSALDELSVQARDGLVSMDVVKTLIALNRSATTNVSTCQISKERRGDPPKENLYGVSEPD